MTDQPAQPEAADTSGRVYYYTGIAMSPNGILRWRRPLDLADEDDAGAVLDYLDAEAGVPPRPVPAPMSDEEYATELAAYLALTDQEADTDD